MTFGELVVVVPFEVARSACAQLVLLEHSSTSKSGVKDISVCDVKSGRKCSDFTAHSVRLLLLPSVDNALFI